MFNEYMTVSTPRDHHKMGALEINLSAREAERRQALMNYLHRGESLADGSAGGVIPFFRRLSSAFSKRSGTRQPGSPRSAALL